ncbi:NADP-dependent alcohol dehydrogenase 6 [Ceratocystis lukuohia]|uniref:alcohol dehydrogenase (NADP(+)) n=2 Tax=Ceratocystis TaxID=5157 RepID=A0A0F8DGW4_CERFI|nr:NADP-dependent alcohol dehydrogenase 6 [Ceratocystis platani]
MPYPDTFRGFAITAPEKFKEPVPYEFKPKPFGEHDIDIKIEACGVCGSDLHTANGGWGNDKWPIVPGHEIIGTALKVGSKVTTVKPGDRVGVGAQVLSCMECDDCKNDNETYCAQWIDTYGGQYRDGTLSQGGYSSHVRAHEFYTFLIPKELETSAAAPMLCAGITAYSPLRRNGAGPGKKVGIVGIGGLGHFGIQFAKALGADTYALSHSAKKKDDALAMGAKDVIVTSADDWDVPHRRSFDLIISTANVFGLDLGKYLGLLKVHCKFISIGLPDGDGWKLKPQDLMTNGAFIGSSHLGSRKEMQEMLQLAVDKGVKTWVETMPVSAENVGKALAKLSDGKVRYRTTLVDYDKQFK